MLILIIKKIINIPISKEVKYFYKMQKIIFKNQHIDKGLFKQQQNYFLKPVDNNDEKSTLINHCKLWIWLGNYFMNNPKQNLNKQIKRQFFNNFQVPFKKHGCYLCDYLNSNCEKCLSWNYLFNSLSECICMDSYYGILVYETSLTKRQKILLCYQIAFLALNTEHNITLKDILKNYNN